MNMVMNQDIPCNLCGGTDYKVMFKQGVAQAAQIVSCTKCDLMFASPRAQLVDHENYERFEAEGLLKGVTTDPAHPYRWRFDKESFQVRDFDQSRKTLEKLYPNGGSMVEVGSGLGYLLREFKDKGWDVLGVDPWKELPAHTREIHDFETIPTTLEAAKLPDESADVVVMLHVIEHVPDPVASMQEIYRILKPGGHMVLETPRYDTLMFKLMGKRERSLRMNGHIYFFSDETLRNTFKKAGFSEVELHHVGRSMTAQRFIWNAANIAKSPKFTEKATRFARQIGLANLKFRLNLADMVRIIVQKPNA